jgi:hypothetical protein
VDGRVVSINVISGDLTFLLWILIFKWLTARRLYKSFGVKRLNTLILKKTEPAALTITYNFGQLRGYLMALHPTYN